MTDLRVIGIDPGPVPGLVVLNLVNRFKKTGCWIDSVEVLQCSAGLLIPLLDAVMCLDRESVLVQVERFVVARRSGRSSTAHAGGVTRDLVGAIEHTVTQYDRAGGGGTANSVQRSAAAVKPWATDERLDRAGLLKATKGMSHARDAGRHALFAACHDGGLTDPLSKEFSR